MADQSDVQFHRAEPVGGAAAVSCVVCGKPITAAYFEANGKVVCESCRRAAEAEWNRGGAAGRLGKALGFGVFAMIACSIVWYLVLKATDSQWGILAVVVGLVVGGAVRKGSNGRGGWRYQALAIFLTYTAIVSSYVPFIIEGLREKARQTSEQPAAAADSMAKTIATATERPGFGAFVIGVVALVALLYATPFLAGIENAIGILIIAFALYEAWKLNKKAELRITGPYQLAGGGGAAPA